MFSLLVGIADAVAAGKGLLVVSGVSFGIAFAGLGIQVARDASRDEAT